VWEKVDELMVDNWMEKLVRDSRCNNNVTRLLCVCVCVMTHASNVFVFFNEAFDWEEPSSSFYFIFSWLLFYSSFSAHRVNVLRPSFVFSYIFLFYFKTFGNDLEPKRKEKKVGVVVKDKSPKGKRRKVFVFRSFSFVFWPVGDKNQPHFHESLLRFGGRIFPFF
jgi:hypothetical protein